MPTVHGEDAVIRILDKESINDRFSDLRLDVLGLSESEVKRIQRFIREPYGMFLVTGPTGSGKTTTLYAALSEIYSEDDKIVTIEDPVEYQLRGITLCDATGLEPTTLEEIRAEASRIFSNSGVALGWRGCERGLANRGEASVFLLAEFPGWLADELGTPRALAHVFTTPDSRPGPLIYVSRRAVAVTLGASRPHFLIGARQLSRAVGRVLAHELAHRFLGKASHSEEAVLRTSFHSRDLLDEDPEAFYFTKEQSENLQNLSQETPEEDDSQR
jgi:energy-coupling factor transporter ATP-binding protein EcfA2